MFCIQVRKIIGGVRSGVTVWLIHLHSILLPTMHKPLQNLIVFPLMEKGISCLWKQPCKSTFESCFLLSHTVFQSHFSISCSNFFSVLNSSLSFNPWYLVICYYLGDVLHTSISEKSKCWRLIQDIAAFLPRNRICLFFVFTFTEPILRLP